nr:hypothetical protein [uncultured Lachnoanaerobaculum sp.]
MTYKHQWMIDFFSNLLEEKKKEGNDRDVAEIKKAIQVIKKHEEEKNAEISAVKDRNDG